jgi:BirA family biotin operon repressor/biotin-[acetyl-CoA-carboxylase] ligase
MTARQVSKWAGQTATGLRRRWKRQSVYLFGKVGSTNDEARRLAEEEAPSGTIVLGREQTGGRGRERKVWHSPPDAGVYLSMVFRPTRVENPLLLPVLAGLGVVHKLDTSFQGLSPGLKWPNDIYAGDRKCGGILAEAAWSDGAPRYLIVGVGINVKPLSDVLPPATSLEEQLGEVVDPVRVADAIVTGLETYLSDPTASLDAEALDLVDHYDWLRDKRISLLPDGSEVPTAGVSVGIAPDGALLFRPDRGALRRVRRGTVVPELAAVAEESGEA